MLAALATVWSTAAAFGAGPKTVLRAGAPLAVQCSDMLLGGGPISPARLKICEDATDDESLTRSERAKAFVNAGIARLRRDDYGRAISHFLKAERLDPSVPELPINLALAYLKAGDADAAISMLNDIESLGAGYQPVALCTRGLAYGQKGDRDRALADFRAALEKHPDDATAVEALRELSTVQ